MEKGTYVRTKKGKIYQYDENIVRLDEIIGDDEIIKTAPNTLRGLLEIIEPGDYVNGLKVTRIDGTYHGRKDKAIYCDYCQNKETGKWTMIYEDEIKDVVTKEMFESIKFKAGE